MIHNLTFSIVLAAALCFVTQRADEKEERSCQIIITNNLDEPPLPVLVSKGERVAQFYLSKSGKLLKRSTNPFALQDVTYDEAADVVAVKMHPNKKCLLFLRIIDPAETNIAALTQGMRKFEIVLGEHVELSVKFDLKHSAETPKNWAK